MQLTEKKKTSKAANTGYKPCSTSAAVNRRLAVAPMMDWTTRDFRYLLRLITRKTLLYSEMLVAQAVIHGDRARLLDFDAAENPLALQLGGSDPALLAEAARIAEGWGYSEVNLNVGCPSDRVQKGKIGAVLMAEPELVAQCVEAMQQAVTVPITVKTRIGIDDYDDYAFLHRFVATVREAGCRSFTIHARKAILSGLSPKENRTIPPLIYQRAADIKHDFADCEILLNGGVKSLDDVSAHLDQVDGVMIGREAYQNPWFLAEADTKVFGLSQNPITQQRDLVAAYFPYLEERVATGMPVSHALRHLLGLFQGQPGARRYRRFLSERMHRADATPALLLEALGQLS